MLRQRILKIAESEPPIEFNDQNLDAIVAGLEKQLKSEGGIMTAALIKKEHLSPQRDDVIIQAMVGALPDSPIKLNIFPGRVKDMIDNLRETKKIV